MIENYFGSAENFYLLLLSLLFRLFRAMHDGLSDLGYYDYTSFNRYLWGRVGAWPWHLLNWAGRDLFIAVLYICLGLNNCPWPPLVAACVLQWLLHDFFYWWTFTHRHYFKWGTDWPSFPSFFKKIFARHIK